MRAVGAAALVMSAAAVAQSGLKVDGAYLTKGGDGSDWPSAGRDYREQRFSPLTRIDAGNVSRLGVAWFADLHDPRGHEATPVMVDGVLYVTGPGSKVFAFDAVSGKPLWTYDPKIDGLKGAHSCCDVVNRGVAVWKGKLYLGALDGRLIALDAATGKALWAVQTTDTTKPYTITGAPRVVKDMVIIGNGGAEFGVRGYVTAYDTATGEKRWRFYTVPNADGKPDGEASDPILAKAAATWSKTGQWRQGALVAWDPVARKARWRVEYPTPWNGSTLATAGNLVFQGTALGEFRAYAADTGKQLWALPVQSGVMAAPSTYTIKRVQYVAFTTSRGGAWDLTSGYAGLPVKKLPSIPRLVVLKLDGKGRLPAMPVNETVAPNPPPATAPAATVAQGKAFGRFCSTCHGANSVSGGVTPDLRYSPVLADAASWKAVVIDGVLHECGMVSFKPVMDEAGAEAARAYVIGEANWAKANDGKIMN